jgi:hypothetical protein
VLVVLVGAALAIGIGLPHRHSGKAGPTPKRSASVSPRTPTKRVTPPPARSLITAAHWQRTSLGYRLRVDPSLYGRNHALTWPPVAFREAVRAAAPTPFALSSSVRQAMTRQLRCHAEFAATKARWDLEAWRPDVSYVTTEQAFCNP